MNDKSGKYECQGYLQSKSFKNVYWETTSLLLKYVVSHQKEFSELENCFTQLYQIRQLLIQALIVWARFYLHRKKGLHLMITYQRMGNSVLMQQILELKKGVNI